jgi:hypothetical protein
MSVATSVPPALAVIPAIPLRQPGGRPSQAHAGVAQDHVEQRSSASVDACSTSRSRFGIEARMPVLKGLEHYHLPRRE